MEVVETKLKVLIDSIFSSDEVKGYLNQDVQVDWHMGFIKGRWSTSHIIAILIRARATLEVHLLLLLLTLLGKVINIELQLGLEWIDSLLLELLEIVLEDMHLAGP